MFYNRATSVASSVVTAVLFTVATGTSAGASVTTIPWTQQTVFELAEDDSYVAEWMGPSSGWTIIGGSATRIYAGSAGVFETDASGNIWVYNGTPYSWTEIGGPGAEFVEGGGHLYGLGPDSSYVAEWNGTPYSWTVIGGPAQYIDAGGRGLIATNPSTGSVYFYNGTPESWSYIGGPGAYFVVGSNAVFRVSTDSTTLDEWISGTTWTPILDNGMYIDGVVAGAAGVFAAEVVPGVDDLYLKYSGVPALWTQIGHGKGQGFDSSDTPYPDVESRTSLYGFGSTADGVMTIGLYSGSDSTWTTIGGPADVLLAAGD